MKILIVTTFFFGVCLLIHAKSAEAFFSAASDPKVRIAASKLIEAKMVDINVDEIDGSITATSALKPTRNSKYFNYISLSVFKMKERVALILGIQFGSDEWLFSDGAQFNVDGKVISLTDKKPHRSVSNYNGGITEQLSWTARTKDVQSVIKAVVSGGKVICRLDGTRIVALSEIDRSEISNMLTVYFAMGGQPLNL